MIPLERLRAPPRAIRTLDAAHVRDVAGSISALGFSVPVLVSRDYFVLDGTARVEAARLLGLERVPCIRIGHLSEDAANAANGREGSRPNDCAIALEAHLRRDRPGPRSRPRPTLRCPIAAPTEAMPRRRRPKVGASPSRRSTRFEFRLATHLLRERLDVGLRYVRVGSCALLGGRTPFDAVDRSALFVRPIDCRREAALAQAGQRWRGGPGRAQGLWSPHGPRPKQSYQHNRPHNAPADPRDVRVSRLPFKNAFMERHSNPRRLLHSMPLLPR